MVAPDVLDRVVVPIEAFDVLVASLRDTGYTVIGPTVRDGAIVLGEIDGTDDLPVGWTDAQEAGTYRLVRRHDEARFGYAVGPHSMRRYLTPPRETLFSIARVDGRLEISPQPRRDERFAFVGVRACDLAAVSIQDRVRRDGRYRDPGYTQRRDEAFVVAVNCADPAATCFCASMGTGPDVTGGFDLALTEILDGAGPDGHRLLVEVGSERGGAVLAEMTSRRPHDGDLAAAMEIADRCRAAMTRHLDPDAARRDLVADLEHPKWDDVAERCLSCANCTLVCPTCFCSSVEDRSSLDGERTERAQRWESCFSLDHSHLHGAGPVRADIRSRYRQWLTHKLSTWWDQFDTSGCVGCGRCITWCPAGIDLTQEVLR